MALTPSFKRLEGVVTGFTAASGRADAVKYSGAAVYIMGGDGLVTFTNERPFRPFASDDMQIATAAPIGSSLTVWFDTDGTRRIQVHMEVYAEEPCA